jgi:hypothetical protein
LAEKKRHTGASLVRYVKERKKEKEDEFFDGDL